MQCAASPVRSAQTAPHPGLARVLTRHFTKCWAAPLHAPSLAMFARLDAVQSGSSAPLLLDSGCGTGESSLRLARLFPGHLVIGIDQSAARLRQLAGAAGADAARNGLTGPAALGSISAACAICLVGGGVIGPSPIQKSRPNKTPIAKTSKISARVIRRRSGWARRLAAARRICGRRITARAGSKPSILNTAKVLNRSLRRRSQPARSPTLSKTKDAAHGRLPRRALLAQEGGQECDKFQKKRTAEGASAGFGLWTGRRRADRR